MADIPCSSNLQASLICNENKRCPWQMVSGGRHSLSIILSACSWEVYFLLTYKIVCSSLSVASWLKRHPKPLFAGVTLHEQSFWAWKYETTYHCILWTVEGPSFVEYLLVLPFSQFPYFVKCDGPTTSIRTLGKGLVFTGITVFTELLWTFISFFSRNSRYKKPFLLSCGMTILRGD